MNSNGDTRVFVFGTLKQGFPNFQFNAGRRIAGHFQLADRYPMYLVGARQSPWLVDDPGRGYQVQGQLFYVDSGALDAMDTLERIQAVDGYRRRPISVLDQNETIHEVFVYFKPLVQLSEAQSLGEIVTGPYPDYTLEMARGYRSRSTMKNPRIQAS